MPTNDNRTLHEWFNEMLSKRGLTAPDGRQLYKYRITDQEFSELENSLRHYVLIGQAYLGFSGLAKRSVFPILFVLYSAEWWRRRYDGSGFSWEPILRDLGANFDEWNQAQRSDCVREGFRAWKLRLEQYGFRFLGSVAIQGGLPMKTLSEARGGIGQLLGRVLRTANKRSVTPADVQNWVESLENYLPKSYRQPAIFVLLADVAWTVLTLKQKANLTSATNAIEQLNDSNPDWRESFPLSIEDDQARSLIEQLVREAATVRLQKPTVCFPVERFLEIRSNGECAISSTINLPETISVEQIAKFFNADAEGLPRFAELSLLIGDQRRTTTLRKMAGHDAYRVGQTVWNVSGATAAGEHLLQLTAADGRVWTATAMKGQQLDSDLPWLFADENSIYRFLRQGAGGAAANEAILTVPVGWRIADQSLAAAKKIGELDDLRADVFKITETVSLENPNGATVRVKLRQAGSEEAESYDWRGNRFWLNFVSPSMAFKGKPILYRIGEDGIAAKINDAPACTQLGATNSSAPLGPVTLTFPASGAIRHRTKMVLLPEDAALKLNFGDATSGSIVFENWKLLSVNAVGSHVRQDQRIEGNSLVLNVSVAAGESVPDELIIETFWRHTTVPARLVVPFPSKGTRAFDGAGREVESGSLVALKELVGTRLKVAGARSERVRLKLQTANGKIVRNHLLQTLPTALALEARIADFLTDIEHLLSLDDSPDASVKISLMIGADESFSLKVARYAAIPEIDGSAIRLESDYSSKIGADAINELLVLALRLENPHDEAIALPFCEEQPDNKYSWDFDRSAREPGSWLIYPGAAAQLSFRPTRFFVPGETALNSEFARAVAIADQTERDAALDLLIANLAANFAHPDWEEIARLAGLVGHLPLTTLDLWRRFARSAEAMAALVFRYGKLPDGFVNRFEQELPFAWEAVSFAKWKIAIRKTKDYCEQIFGSEAGAVIFAAHVKTQADNLTARHGALSFLFGIILTEFFPETVQEVEALRFYGKNNAKQGLFVGENSRLMNLRRVHANDDWVKDTGAIFDRKMPENLLRFLHDKDFGLQNYVINAPLLLAAKVAKGDSDAWLADAAKVHSLRSFRAFDSEWFDEAFNLTIARCLAEGLLND